MGRFGDYALYYNLLYADKDYGRECQFVLALLEKYGVRPQSLLDLGCGTGRHALQFASRGINVTGVDISDTMLKIGAQAMLDANQPRLLHGDVRDIRLKQRFSAVVSLFHVASYQISERDCLNFMRTAWEHLDAGGLFLADFWFGPGVLHLRPETRLKNMENGQIQVTRRAAASMDITRDLVKVRYDVAIRDKASGEIRELAEDHLMRYWFLPEFNYLATETGFLPVASGAWLSEAPAGENDWAAWSLFRKMA